MGTGGCGHDMPGIRGIQATTGARVSGGLSIKSANSPIFFVARTTQGFRVTGNQERCELERSTRTLVARMHDREHGDSGRTNNDQPNQIDSK